MRAVRGRCVELETMATGGVKRLVRCSLDIQLQSRPFQQFITAFNSVLITQHYQRVFAFTAVQAEISQGGVHAHSHTHTHTHTHTRVHVHMNTHTHTNFILLSDSLDRRTHTHTHTHANFISLSPFPFSEWKDTLTYTHTRWAG